MGIEWSWGKFSKPSWGRTRITDNPLSVLASECKNYVKTHLKDLNQPQGKKPEYIADIIFVHARMLNNMIISSQLEKL